MRSCPVCRNKKTKVLNEEGIRIHCQCVNPKCKVQFTEINKSDTPGGYFKRPRIKNLHKHEFNPKLKTLAEGLINSEPLFIPMPDWEQKDLENREDGRYKISFLS